VPENAAIFRMFLESREYSCGLRLSDDDNHSLVWCRPIASELFRESLRAEVGVTAAGKRACRRFEKSVI